MTAFGGRQLERIKRGIPIAGNSKQPLRAPESAVRVCDPGCWLRAAFLLLLLAVVYTLLVVLPIPQASVSIVLNIVGRPSALAFPSGPPILIPAAAFTRDS